MPTLRQHPIIIGTLALLAVPTPAFAITTPPSTFAEVVGLIVDLLRGAAGIGWMLLSLGFVYGVFKFLVNFDNEKEREEGKRLMYWSIIAVAVMLSIWGILTLINDSFFGATSGFGIPTLTPP